MSSLEELSGNWRGINSTPEARACAKAEADRLAQYSTGKAWHVWGAEGSPVVLESRKQEAVP